MSAQLANQPQELGRIEKQKRELLAAMRECVQDLFTADSLFADTLDLLSADQLDALTDLLVNHYGAEEEA
jgi:hypothetical protein